MKRLGYSWNNKNRYWKRRPEMDNPDILIWCVSKLAAKMYHSKVKWKIINEEEYIK